MSDKIFNTIIGIHCVTALIVFLGMIIESSIIVAISASFFGLFFTLTLPVLCFNEHIKEELKNENNIKNS